MESVLSENVAVLMVGTVLCGRRRAAAARPGWDAVWEAPRALRWACGWRNANELRWSVEVDAAIRARNLQHSMIVWGRLSLCLSYLIACAAGGQAGRCMPVVNDYKQVTIIYSYSCVVPLPRSAFVACRAGCVFFVGTVLHMVPRARLLRGVRSRRT